MNPRTTLYLVLLLISVIVIIGVIRWQNTHHHSADQEILLRKAHQH